MSPSPWQRALLCAAAALAALAAGAAAEAVPKLPYLAHSFNDLAFHRQLLTKGVRWFKLDIQPADRASCAGFSSWTGGKCFESAGHELCCLALRGDTSSAPSLAAPFNTSADLLAFLNASSSAYWYKNAARGAIHFELDFDVGVPPSTDPVYPLYDEFLTGLKTLITQPDPVQLVTPGYLGFESNVNIDVSSVASECDGSGWPQSPYPYSWWEPSSQAPILDAFYTFRNCTKVPANHRNLNNGTVVTCNQEPEMYEVFASPLIARGGNNIVQPSGSNPHIAALDAGNAMAPGYTAASWTDGSEQWLGIYCMSGASSKLVASQALPSSAKAPVTSLSTRDGTTVTVTLQDGTLMLYQATLATGSSCSASLSTQPQTMHLGNTGAVLAAQMLVMGTAPTAAALVANMTANCKLGVMLSTSPAVSACISNATVVHADQASLSFAQMQTSTFTGVAVFADNAVSPPIVHGAVVDVQLGAQPAVQVTTGSAGAGGVLPQLDVGTNPDVQIVVVDSTPVVMEVHTNGMCQCGFAINNGNLNHCEVPTGTSGAAAGLRSITNQMNYNYGTLDAWRAKIVAGGYMSSCDTCIIHGKFDTGGSPSITVLPQMQRTARGEQVLQVVELHNGNVATSPLGSLCGAPIQKHGLVMDSWHVPAPALVEASCAAAAAAAA